MVDEPSLGLSPVMVDQVFDVLGALVRDGMALVLAEQNVRKALQVTHHAYVLAQGQRIQQRPKCDAVGRPACPRIVSRAGTGRRLWCFGGCGGGLAHNPRATAWPSNTAASTSRGV